MRADLVAVGVFLTAMGLVIVAVSGYGFYSGMMGPNLGWPYSMMGFRSGHSLLLLVLGGLVSASGLAIGAYGALVRVSGSS